VTTLITAAKETIVGADEGVLLRERVAGASLREQAPSCVSAFRGRCFGMIWIRINDPRSLELRSWCIKEADQSVTRVVCIFEITDPDANHLKRTHPSIPTPPSCTPSRRFGDLFLGYPSCSTSWPIFQTSCLHQFV